MITQKQIDTRDEYIKLLNAEVAHWAGFLHAHRCFSEHAEQGRILRKAIADADWESYKTRIADADEEAFEHCTAPDITYCKAEIGKTECGRNCKWYKERIAEN